METRPDLMKHLTFLMAIIGFLLVSFPVSAAKDWQEVETVKEVCEQYPERISDLLEKMNLEQEGLAGVGAAFGGGDLEKAGKAAVGILPEW